MAFPPSVDQRSRKRGIENVITECAVVCVCVCLCIPLCSIYIVQAWLKLTCAFTGYLCNLSQMNRSIPSDMSIDRMAFSPMGDCSNFRTGSTTTRDKNLQFRPAVSTGCFCVCFLQCLFLFSFFFRFSV